MNTLESKVLNRRERTDILCVPLINNKYFIFCEINLFKRLYKSSTNTVKSNSYFLKLDEFYVSYLITLKKGRNKLRDYISFKVQM